MNKRGNAEQRQGMTRRRTWGAGLAREGGREDDHNLLLFRPMRSVTDWSLMVAIPRVATTVR